MEAYVHGVPKTADPMIASIIRTIFTQPDTKHVRAQFDEVVRILTRSHPTIADMPESARDDLLASTGFPIAHWRQIWSTNPAERVNNETKPRTDVVSTLPNPTALLRLAGDVEQHDERDGAGRRYFNEHPMAGPAPHRTRGDGDPRTDRGIIRRN